MTTWLNNPLFITLAQVYTFWSNTSHSTSRPWHGLENFYWQRW